MQEIEVLNTIRHNLRSHSNILAHMATLAIGTEDFSILSEFADGGDLHQFLHGEFTGFKSHRDRILEETSNIADAIDFLHKSFRINGEHHPCYHLDLKPANVLVFSRRNRQPELKDDVGEWVITDFGVSVLHESVAEGASKTFARREPGTYQPPEIDDKLGSPSVNAKGDVWSLGGILCMILAFLHDGRRSVEWLNHVRSRTATGPQAQDFYYLVQHHGDRAKAVLKPTIQDWLSTIQESGTNIEWVTEMVDIVRHCLTIDQLARPDANSVYKRLIKLQPRSGLHVRTNSDVPQPPQRPIKSPTITSPPPQPLQGFFQKLKHKRAAIQPVPQTPRQRSRAGSRSPIQPPVIPLTPPSTGSAANFRYSTSSVEMLTPHVTATCVQIEPNGRHIVLCFPQNAVVFDLIPNSRSHASFCDREQPIAGTFDSIYVSGHFLVLYDKSTLEVVPCCHHFHKLC